MYMYIWIGHCQGLVVQIRMFNPTKLSLNDAHHCVLGYIHAAASSAATSGAAASGTNASDAGASADSGKAASATAERFLPGGRGSSKTKSQDLDLDSTPRNPHAGAAAVSSPAD